MKIKDKMDKPAEFIAHAERTEKRMPKSKYRPMFIPKIGWPMSPRKRQRTRRAGVGRQDGPVEELDSDREDDSLQTAPNPLVRYLQDIRSLPLLSRDEEINLSRQIERGARELLEEAFSSSVALGCALDLGKTVAAGKWNMRDVVKLRVEASGEHLHDEKILKSALSRRRAKTSESAKSSSTRQRSAGTLAIPNAAKAVRRPSHAPT